MFGLTKNIWNLNCKSVLLTTTWSPFIHAGLPASSKHFEHRYYLTSPQSFTLLYSHAPQRSLLALQTRTRPLTDPDFCSCTLRTAHSVHFKQRHDLSLLLTSALARSTVLTATTLNTDMTSHCSTVVHTSALARSTALTARTSNTDLSSH